MQRSIYVPLPESAIPPLVELAQREMREPKAMAAWLILDGLRRAGLDVRLETRDQAALTKAGVR